MILSDTYTANKCVNAIEELLQNAIMTADDASLQRLFPQDPRINRRRTMLEDTHAKMARARERISNFANRRSVSL